MEDGFKALGFIAMLIILIVGFFAMVNLVADSPLWTAAGASWIQSIGSIGAIIGAIWISTSEQRRRRRQERDLAFVAICSAQIKAEQIDAGVGGAILMLEDCHKEGFGFDYHAISLLVSSAGSFENEEIFPLINLPNTVAARMARVRTGMIEVIDFFGTCSERIKADSDANMGPFNRALLIRLNKLKEDTSVISAECKKPFDELERYWV